MLDVQLGGQLAHARAMFFSPRSFSGEAMLSATVSEG